MNETNVRIAMVKCQIFMKRIDEALRDSWTADNLKKGLGKGTKQSGALRRASMELTRSLAEMRKAG